MRLARSWQSRAGLIGVHHYRSRRLIRSAVSIAAEERFSEKAGRPAASLITGPSAFVRCVESGKKFEKNRSSLFPRQDPPYPASTTVSAALDLRDRPQAGSACAATTELSASAQRCCMDSDPKSSTDRRRRT